MPKTYWKNTSTSQNKAVMKWLYIFAGLIAFLVIFGGFVRLTRSGLSIVEWNPINGMIPPFSQHQWDSEFEKYKQTPEYLQINTGMTLEEYKFIFYMEWFHRFIARRQAWSMPFLFFIFYSVNPFRSKNLEFIS
jgi:cytochrome c oxidase assembly protein subunit 15